MSADNADIDRLLPHVRTVVRQFQQIFPEFTVISGYRDPNHNHSVGGAGDSRHVHRDAFDFKPAPDTPPERRADAVNWLRSQGAMGFGTYDRDGSSFHADWRESGPAMWGPNRSRTSLDRTPDWFQTIAQQHFAGAPAPTRFATVPPGSIPDARPASGGGTAQMVYDKLTSLGVPSKTAAGAVGSLMGESGRGLNTSALNRGDGADGSDSIGMGQWNGSRATALKRVAGEMGLPWTDPRVQVEHLGRELQGTHSYVLRDLRNGADSIDRGANVWTNRYEVAAPATAHQDRRIQNGYAFANQLANGPTTQVAANGAYAPGQPLARPYVEAKPQTGAFGGYRDMQVPALGGDTPARPIGASPVAQAAPAAPVTALASGPQAGGPTRPWGSDSPAPAAVTPQTTTGPVAAAEANPQSPRYWPQDPREPWSATPPSAATDALPQRPTGSSPIASLATRTLMPDTTGATPTTTASDSGGDNPLIIRHIRPHQEPGLAPQTVPLPPQRPTDEQLAMVPQTVPLPPQRPTDAQLAQVPQDVPLPPQRPADDQLFARPIGASPVQQGWQDYQWITNPDGSIGTAPWINPVPHYEPPTGGGLFGALGLTD